MEDINVKEIDEQKEHFLKKIKGKTYLFYYGGVGLIILGIIFYFTIKSDWSIGVLTGLIGLAAIWIGYLKFGSKKAENIVIVEAKCIEKTRSGYRKQYFEYVFEEMSGRSFTVQTAQKEKFTKGLTYNLCFDKSEYEKEKISGSSLLYHESI